MKLRAVLRERRRKTLEVKGKLARAKAKLKKTQVRGVPTMHFNFVIM